MLSRFQQASRQFTSHAANNLLVRASITSSPNTLAFIDGDKSVTYGDFVKRAGQYATALTDHYKIQKGDRVLSRVSKTVDTAALYIACLQIGAIYIPVNPSYTEREAAHFVKDSEPSLFVTNNEKIDNLFKDRVRNVVEENALARQTAGFKSATDIEHVASSDPASVCYTSGTTGLPKGAVLTHGGLSANGEQIVKAWGFTETDRNLHCLPFYHVHGMYISLHSTLFSHSTLVWRSKFDADDCVHHMRNSTVMMGVPTYFTRLLAHPKFDKSAFGNMRTFISGSAPLSVATIEEFKKKTGQTILERYGMTEAQVVTTNPLHGERRAGTVGPVLDGVELRLSENGGVEIRSPSVFAGYWRNPEKTAADFTSDGWFKTGDVGTLDENGYLSIAGRSKDMIISGGLNVYPKEVEDTIDQVLPEISESAVIASPHPDFGEAVVAVVALRKKPEGFDERKFEKEVQHVLKEKLANYKVPKRVIVLDELPRNHMSKVQKNVMRETYKNLFQ